MTIRPILLASLLLAACATPAPPPVIQAPEPIVEKAEPSPETEEALSLLGYFQHLTTLSADDLKREYQNVNQAYGRERSEASRLRLAMLLALPGAPWRDDARLVALLEASATRADAPDSPRRQLVTLLQRLAADRLREGRRLDGQLKEEQRKADEAQRRADEAQHRADELQQKLDAMVNIERNLQRGRR